MAKESSRTDLVWLWFVGAIFAFVAAIFLFTGQPVNLIWGAVALAVGVALFVLGVIERRRRTHR